MFAYCQNNPAGYVDSFGLRPVSVLERFGDTSIPTPPPKRKKEKANSNESSTKSKTVMDKWQEKGVTYKSNGAGKGGKIENSYLIKEYEDIYEYSEYLVNESEYRDDFTGSVEGVVFEWDIHNIIYYYGPPQWEDNARDVDFGRTIFSDSHKGLNMVMWLGFYLNYPEQYYSDLFC